MYPTNKLQAKEHPDQWTGNEVCRQESDGTGGTVKVVRFPDGSSIVDFGGMGGTAYYDQDGEEA